jgi:hypothetical protein
MPGKIPGLRSLKAGPPQSSTAGRGKGFSLAVIAVLETPSDFAIYVDHPIHVAYFNLPHPPQASQFCNSYGEL